MKRLIVGLLPVLLLIGLISCSGSGVSDETAPTPAARPSPTPAPEAGSPVVPTSVNDAGQFSDSERMVVHTANMQLLVEDIRAAIDEITDLADRYQGYVVSSRTWRERDRLIGTITIRVQAQDFTAAMDAIRALADDVVSDSTSSKDVTEEYVDLDAKLRNLEVTEEQLLRLIEKAEDVEDILAIQRELSKTRSEIEQTKGRMQYLERTSETSLIEVRLEQAKLDVSFTAHKRSVKKGEDIRFMGEIVGGFTPYSYEWDFGDGNTSTSEAPAHTYRSTGTYTVSLTVTDDQGNTDTEIRSDYITVLPGWSAFNVARGAWNGLILFGQILTDIVIWVVIFSPVWLAAGVVRYLWLRRRKKG